jgi:dCTP deaminase
MSILSDRQIKQLCTPPSFVITEMVATRQDPEFDVYMYPQEVKSFSYLSEEEILAKSITSRSDVGIKCYRVLTEEEIASFKPMISPFVPNQVRTEQVEPTHEQKYDFNRGHIRNKGMPSFLENYVLPEGATVDEDGFRVQKKIISYGLSSYGYDVRLGRKFKIFSNLNNTVIDPLNFDESCLHDHEGDYVIIPPNSYILGKTIEYFTIPKDVMVICVGKSTYARCGAIVNVTPIEPGFAGNIVIEISNSTSLPLKVYADQGIAQFVFFQGTEPCEVSYADKGGKYQGQTTIQLPIG